jgi:hypothetical protein
VRPGMPVATDGPEIKVAMLAHGIFYVVVEGRPSNG